MKYGVRAGASGSCIPAFSMPVGMGSKKMGLYDAATLLISVVRRRERFLCRREVVPCGVTALK
jgi:hypothetical protein